ncbi:poly [ADP-ribose] polymerase 2 [Aplysia californica]|uniref:Poly [ADP-ribose] polymerase n=1 Tax=Aplysia californica TaxID=6500 RepID=A0ABM1A495_APLCA|nr:poly [ADP-ribose] polymerase 2 [Aplysia californica]
MSTRRTSKRTSSRSQSAASAASTSSKKAKLSFPEIDGCKMRFEWEGDGGKWVRYTKEYNRILTDACSADKDKVELTVPSGAKMLVLFDKMVQKNKKTGWERRVRIGLKSAKDNDFMVTSWQDESNKWCSYSVATCLEIAKAVGEGEKSVQLESTPVPYDIDLKKMTQTNCKSNFSRKIKREIAVSDVPPDDDEEEEAEEAEKEDDKTSVKKESNGAGQTTGTAKGSVPAVDPNCTAKSASVYVEDGVAWSCYLTQTSASGTSIKFYLLQIVKETASKFALWIRYGKEGCDGTHELTRFGAQLENAKDVFMEKFKAKTGNLWDNKDSFVKKANKYDFTGDSVVTVPVKEEQEEEEEMEEEEPKPKSGRGKGKSAATKSTVRTVKVKKGSAPVDSLCPIADSSEVYTAGNVVWDCMLNQTNISNNNNKFYLIQLLKKEGKDSFHVWMRWGRVGYNGQNELTNCAGSVDDAKKIFQKKFRDKTANDWALRDNFVKHPGKYDLLKMDYSTDDKTEDQVDASIKTGEEEDVKTPDSKLEKKLQDLVNLICNVKSMEDAVVEMKYDAKKAPLGKLTKDQIKAGYTALKEIESLLEKNDTGRNLAEACSEFYTRIPHEFGMQTPPLIRTPQMVKKKLELLEALEDIEIAIKMLQGGDKSENPVDRHYHQLKCELKALDHGADEFKWINKYLQQTHAATHNMYKMELLDVYECQKDGEASQFQDFGNRMLLWHGSRLTNWAGILGQGLRIAPPEAPVTGYMFGKGVYFADMSSKSANYCFATKSKNIGLLLLCDVSLGTTEDKLAADYNAAKLPNGKNSVCGLGRVAPDPAASMSLADGVTVPLGKAKDTGVVNPSGYTLNYNEFIVYNTQQVLMKYLVQVKFNFK